MPLWLELWQNADKWGNLAQVATAIIAVVALLFAWQQIRSNHKAQREATTSVKYRDFLCLALEHPDLANPSLHKVDYQGLTFDGDRIKFEKYDWYVTVMLNVCAEIARTDPDKQNMIKTTLTPHKDYFRSEYWKSTFDEDYWNARMRKLLKQVMVEGG